MRLTAESTEKIVHLNGVPARIWEATTESGIPCFLFVTRVAVANEAKHPGLQYEFERELQEHRVPSAETEGFPLRMIL